MGGGGLLCILEWQRVNEKAYYPLKVLLMTLTCRRAPPEIKCDTEWKIYFPAEPLTAVPWARHSAASPPWPALLSPCPAKPIFTHPQPLCPTRPSAPSAMTSAPAETPQERREEDRWSLQAKDDVRLGKPSQGRPSSSNKNNR